MGPVKLREGYPVVTTGSVYSLWRASGPCVDFDVRRMAW